MKLIIRMTNIKKTLWFLNQKTLGYNIILRDVDVIKSMNSHANTD